MRDEQARRRIRESTGRSVLVEAAAGTGKTALVIDRILHGVRTGALRLNRTAAITFTEKAAAELEERLREALVQSLHDPALPPQQRRHLEAALPDLDVAHIGTIHSFCARILRQKPAESGIDPDFAVLEAPSAALLEQECWRDWLGAQAAGSAGELVEALRAGLTDRQLLAVASALVAVPEVVEAGFELPAPSGTTDALAELAQASRQVDAAFADLMRGRGSRDSRAFRVLARRAARAADPASVRRAAYGAARIDPEAVLRSFGKSAAQARPAVERFSQLSRRLGADLAARVLLWLRGFLGHYQDAKRARSALDFQDLLVVCARLLRRRGDVRRSLQDRFTGLFVDEFQDTDPLQAEVVAYLCEDPTGPVADRLAHVRLADGRLTAVGDPKQSIYRFRRADVQTYERVKQLLGADAVVQIHSTFRSTPPLVSWLNRFFGRAFEPTAEDGVYQAAHVALSAVREDPGAGRPAVAAVCPGPRVPRDGWRAPDARRWEARHLARMIGDLVAGGLSLLPASTPLSYRSFAMLFRALTDVDIYQQALDEAGVPCRATGGRHFYRRAQTQETLALLSAVDDPLNEAAVVGSLRSTYFGLSDEDLMRHVESGGTWDYLRPAAADGPVTDAMALLAQWHLRRNRTDPHLLLSEVFDVTKAPQAYALKPAGPQREAALDQLLRRVRSLGRSTRSFSALVRHLRSISDAELPEEEPGPLEADGDFVELLSMHRAKGLEFPVVVLADLYRRSAGVRDVGPLLLDRSSARAQVSLARGLCTDGFPALQAREHANALAEERRLLYVACTRARDLLVLPVHWGTERSVAGLGALLDGSGCLAPADAVPFGQDADGVHYVDTRDWSFPGTQAVNGGPPDREADAAARRLLAARSAWAERNSAIAARLSQGEDFVLPSELGRHGPPGARVPADTSQAMLLGTVFHNTMARASLGGDGDGGRELERIAQLEAALIGADMDTAAAAAALALSAVACPAFRELLQSADAFRQEVPFCVPVSAIVPGTARDALVEGSIDLFIECPDRTVVLDYKTDAAVRPDAYWPQLALYGMAARACGRARGRVELALFFVRHGRILCEPLASDLVAQVAGLAEP
jgi:ATP-dependent helicase/nuclease subunit A